jgi:hypothetical protein
MADKLIKKNAFPDNTVLEIIYGRRKFYDHQVPDMLYEVGLLTPVGDGKFSLKNAEYYATQSQAMMAFNHRMTNDASTRSPFAVPLKQMFPEPTVTSPVKKK